MTDKHLDKEKISQLIKHTNIQPNMQASQTDITVSIQLNIHTSPYRQTQKQNKEEKQPVNQTG